MADKHGDNLDRAVPVDEGQYQVGPGRLAERRTAQPSNPPPGAVVITLSDGEEDIPSPNRRRNEPVDDDEGSVEIAETALAWTAAQNKRRSEHRTQVNQRPSNGSSRNSRQPAPPHPTAQPNIVLLNPNRALTHSISKATTSSAAQAISLPTNVPRTANAPLDVAATTQVSADPGPQIGSNVPIGALAEHSDREQATCNRDHATPETERVTKNGAIKVSNPSLSTSTQLVASQSMNQTKFRSKQRAIKTAQEYGPPRAKPLPLQTNRYGATDTVSRSVPETRNPSGINKVDDAPLHNHIAETSSILGQSEARSMVTSKESPVPSPAQTRTQTLPTRGITKPDSADTPRLQSSDAPLDPNETGGNHPSTMATSQMNTNDISAVRSAIDGCVKHHLQSRFEAHAYLTKTQLWRQRTCHEQEARALRNQQGPKRPSLPVKYSQSISPFADMPSIQIPLDKHSHRDHHSIGFSQEIFPHGKPKSAVSRSSWHVPVTSFKSDGIAVPPFKEYVSLQESVLADNESKMHLMPYFHDFTDSPEDLRKELPRQYEITQDSNVLGDLRQDQCRFYEDPVQRVLEYLGISWDDVLYWLLAPEQDIKFINNKSTGSSQFERCLLERSQYERETSSNEEVDIYILFERDTKDTNKWQSFLSSLPEPTTKRLRLSALTCAAFLDQCHFNIWYLAEKAKSLLDWKSRKLRHPSVPAPFQYRNIMCRVCHLHTCLHHGEIRQTPGDAGSPETRDDITNTRNDSDHTEPDAHTMSDEASVFRSGTGTSEDELSIADNVPQPHNSQLSMNSLTEEANTRPAHEDSDSDIERVINYRVFANATSVTTEVHPDAIRRKTQDPPDGKFNIQYWKRTNTWKMDQRKPFIPCSHEGSCDQAKCRCYRENINCEKTCKCSRSCKRRFPGCTCAGKGKPCSSQPNCLCREFNRECDADLCSSCGAVEVLDPVNRYDEKVLQGRCTNVQIQRSVSRKTLMGSSKVHGFGLYAGEDFQCDDLVGEYVGETTSQEESDRRATIYDHQKTMYQFQLNGSQEVDGTYMGNKIRFMNNADPKYANCRPMLLLCNTVIRIALYANERITAGTELLFHYGYPKEKEEKQDFRNPGGKEVDGVRKAAKQSTKQNTRQKPRHTSSHGSPRPSSAEPASRTNEKTTNPRILAATAKAREAKRLKYEARLAVERDQASTTVRNFLRPQSRTQSLDSRTSQQVSTRASNEREGPNIENLEHGLIPRNRGRSRHASPRTTSVYAVKDQTERRIQSNAGTKRKRPIIANSDDE
ncbi:hypothetical protein IQ07DRAFT_22575 [Pyrenochaeta sp. DS3sAY3a]|nr:hypothetical protein IQ07DRAFT_22575 [Pyrenochaeta sp. DS3sAY3a]